MRYKKHFTFYANAPVDRANVDVAGTRDVLRFALSGLSVYDNGAKSGGSVAAQEWADFNFSPLQKTLFAPMPPDVKITEINYLRVDFYDGEYTEENDVPAYTFFYFVDDAKPDDEGESLNGDALTIFALTLDSWATNVLYGSPRFFGGTLTNASVLSSTLVPNLAAALETPTALPFDVRAVIGEETSESVFTNANPGTFCAVVQLTAKKINRVLLCLSPATGLKNAIEIAQAVQTTKRLGFQTDGEYVMEFGEGETAVNGAFVVPADIAPWVSREEMQDSGSAIYPITGGGLEPAPWVFSVLEDEGVVMEYAETAARAYEQAFGENMSNGSPYFPNVRVTVGTAFNRVDITEIHARGEGLSPIIPEDIKIRAVWGFNTFNIFMKIAGTTEKDITSDFQIFALVDPENDYIRQNKTNAVLSSVGSIGSIVAGSISIASGGGALAGVGLVGGGIAGLARTANGFAVAASAPDVISSGGYGDVTCSRGGVYYEFLPVEAWKTVIALQGIKRNIPINGEFGLLGTHDARVKVNTVAIAGARVSGMPAGDAEEIANILQRGVRLWYNYQNYAERSI